MNRSYTKSAYALGQVIVMAFEEERGIITSFDNLSTVLIIKPKVGFDTAYYKFPGGMLLPDETFIAAAARELKEETGVVASADPRQLVEMYRQQKPRHSPDTGVFDVVFYAAFGCNFKERYLVDLNERGDEHEESAVARFGDLTTPDYTWPIVSQPGDHAGLFPYHRSLLEAVGRKYAT